jgi:hypothetical protein
VKRSYTSFPGRWPGVGLLLLRIAVSGFELAAGLGFLSPLIVAADQGMIFRAGELLCAVLVGLGLFTQLGALVGATVLLTIAARTLSLMVAELSSAVVFAVCILISLSLVFLGPGTLSLDAYLFGPREIVIPRRTD